MHVTMPETVLRMLTSDACASIRYQSLRLWGGAPAALKSARSALANSEDAGVLLGRASRAEGGVRFQAVHGATNLHWENILPMLLDRGLDSGFASFDRVARSLFACFDQSEFPMSHCFHEFVRIVLTPFLLMAGYREHELMDYCLARLELVSGFCARMDFDLYAEQGMYRGIPKPFRGRPVIRPELYQNGMFQLPMIYDLYAYGVIYGEVAPEIRRRIEQVLAYVLSGPYQRLVSGYGLLREGSGHYYAMGWDAILPASLPMNTCEDGALSARVLHRMELLAGFPIAVRSEWFQRHLALLMTYQTDEGLFVLPKAALREKEGYWVLGSHMGLGENRRKKQALPLEGTFRAHRLLSRMNQTLRLA